MQSLVNEQKLKSIDKVAKMAVAHAIRNENELQKISQLRTEINSKRTHLPRAEQQVYVQELVDCY